MALPVDFWNKLNNKQAAQSRECKRLLQSLQAIRPDSVSLLRSPSDESWLGQLVKRGQRFSKDRVKSFSGGRNRCHQNASCIWSKAR
jgi:hypothetical protein